MRIPWDWARQRWRTCLHFAVKHTKTSFRESVLVSHKLPQAFWPNTRCCVKTQLREPGEFGHSCFTPGFGADLQPPHRLAQNNVQNSLLKVTPEINGRSTKRAQVSLIHPRTRCSPSQAQALPFPCTHKALGKAQFITQAEKKQHRQNWNTRAPSHNKLSWSRTTGNLALCLYPWWTCTNKSHLY